MSAPLDVTDRSLYRRTVGIEHDPLTGPRRHLDDRGREVAPDLLALMGDTPLVSLDRLSRDVPPTLIAKLEMLNPGGSVKDRIGISMIEAAEAAGVLQPGGTIVEPTSGNTGVGLAIASAYKGYRCVFVVPDKVSNEKVALMRAYGAEVVVCPTAVEPEDPRSYYSVSDRLAAQPNAFKPNQYFNQANPQTHRFSTGPELWRQTNGLIDAFVCGVGTGGTATGVGGYLKERKNPRCRSWAPTPKGPSTRATTSTPTSSRASARTSGPRPSIPRSSTGGTGCRTVTRSSPHDAAHARRGCSSAARAAPPCGRRSSTPRTSPRTPRSWSCCRIPDAATCRSSSTTRGSSSTGSSSTRRGRGRSATCCVPRARTCPPLVHLHPGEPVAAAINLLKEYGVSQMPVFRDDVHDDATSEDVIGSVRENSLLDAALRDAEVMTKPVIEVMQPPLPVAATDDDLDAVFASLATGSPAVMVTDAGRAVGVLTRADLLNHLATRGG
jgi:cystathionine beta-synthase